MEMKVPVHFSLTVKMKVPADLLFQSLIDWEDHASWIPMTKIRITKEISGHQGRAHVGQQFSTRTGFGPLGFYDNMQVTALDEEKYSCEVEKIGPVLTGRAGFTLTPGGSSTNLTWYEEVFIPLPKILSPLLSPLLAFIGSMAFRISLKKLAKHLASL